MNIKTPLYRSHYLLPDVPAEKVGTISFGLSVHLVPIFIFIALISYSHFSLPAIGGSFLITSFYTLLLIHWAEKNDPCVSLDPLSKNDLVEGLSLVFAIGAGAGTIVVTGGFLILSREVTITWQYGNWSSIFIALLLTDFSYYCIHRLLNHSKKKNFLCYWYRKIHARHHTVKELDFYRGNLSTFFDTAITGFQPPLILIGVVLGMSLETVLTTYGLIMLLQSTHHANHTFNIGLLRYFFVDNHSHKLHHCPRGYEVNFGAIFSIWDLLFRTYYEEWGLSASYMAKHRISLPIQKINS